MKRPIAAIDIGTNSIHMIVAQSDSDGQIQALDREQQSVRLGEGGDSFDLIQNDAADRAVATLKGFAQIAKSHNAMIYAVSTSAVREAKNQAEFVSRVKRDCGIKITVIPGQEEARLIYLGVLQNLPLFDKKILMIDIGGGSTEYLIGEKGIPEFIQSLKLGAIRTTERFFQNGDVNSKSINACRTFLQHRLESMKNQIPNFDFSTVVGSSGTIKTILELISRLIPSSNRASNLITSSDLENVIERLFSIKTAKDRMKTLSLPDKRADIITGGALILQESFHVLGIDQMVYSPFALREGVVYEILQRRNKKEDLNQIRKKSVLSLAKKFLNRNIPDETSRICELILLALHDIQKAHLVDQDLLEYGAILHNIGLTISHAGHHKHSMYIIQNSDTLLGFSSREINFIAALSRYHRKTSPNKNHIEFTSFSVEDQERIRLFAGILRVAIGLSRTDQRLIKSVKAKIINTKEIQLIFQLSNTLFRAKQIPDFQYAINSAELRKNLLEETLKCSVSFQVEDERSRL